MDDYTDYTDYYGRIYKAADYATLVDEDNTRARADRLMAATGWGLATTWWCIQEGRMDRANRRMDQIDQMFAIDTTNVPHTGGGLRGKP